MAPRVERKLAAILAADVVGYSRLVGADEAGTIARLKALRKEFIEPLVAEYRGRVVKLVGDGALVEFASAVDAVECAVAVQNGVAERQAAEPEDRRIQFRIGINVGDIIVEDAISWATASTSPRASRASPSPAASASPATSTTRSRRSSTSPSSRWASTGSRTSPTRSPSTGSTSMLRAALWAAVRSGRSIAGWRPRRRSC
jgi:class 3 adenylate cyclase